MADNRQEESRIYDACTPLKECEGILSSTKSKEDENNGLVNSTQKESNQQMINSTEKKTEVLINSTEKQSEAQKVPDEDPSAVKPPPEPGPNPSSAEACTDQIEAAPPPPEPKLPSKRKRGRRGKPRSTRPCINRSPEPELQDNQKRQRGRPKITDDDDWLPPDWELRTETRQNGVTAGRKDKVLEFFSKVLS